MASLITYPKADKKGTDLFGKRSVPFLKKVSMKLLVDSRRLTKRCNSFYKFLPYYSKYVRKLSPESIPDQAGKRLRCTVYPLTGIRR
jgi:hypothetical protein